MGMKRIIELTVGLIGAALLSCIALALIGGCAAIVSGSYSAVMGYLF